MLYDPMVIESMLLIQALNVSYNVVNNIRGTTVDAKKYFPLSKLMIFVIIIFVIKNGCIIQNFINT